MVSNPITDKGVFPIAVWLQSPAEAARYKAAGFNLYVGLWKGPTKEQLATLAKANMPVVCDQNEVGLNNRSNPIIAAWMHGDEPDNAQAVTDPATGKQTWGPFVPPPQIVADYRRIKQADPSRPVLLNLGQGVANDGWIGRGSGAKLSDYETYVQGCDIASFDVYPVAGLGKPDQLGLVAKGVDRLVQWTAAKKRVWNCLECTSIDGKMKPTPAQVKAEAWSAIIHGSTGLIYFVHQFAPSFNEHALLDDPEMLSAVTELNKQIQDLAPVLLSKPVRIAPSNHPDIHVSQRSWKGTEYTLAVSLADRPVIARIKLASGDMEHRFKPYELKILRTAR
jgi:hypothetical protein